MFKFCIGLAKLCRISTHSFRLETTSHKKKYYFSFKIFRLIDISFSPSCPVLLQYICFKPFFKSMDIYLWWRMRVRRKCTSTIYSNTRAEKCSFKTKEIDQAAAKLAMGISEFEDKKYLIQQGLLIAKWTCLKMTK